MVLPTAPAAVLSSVPPEDMGRAAGAYNTLQRLGSALAVALAATVFSAAGGLGTPQSFDAGFRPALALLAGISVIGSICALAIRRAVQEPLPVTELSTEPALAAAARG